MQITLNQVEIEAALKAYILNQININDGMEIVIDLKATRGEAGTTAIIDIVPRTEEKAEPVVTQKAATKVSPTPKVNTTSMAKVVEEAQAEPEPEKDLPKEDLEPQEEAEPEPEVEAETETEAEPATARPSLFKGLGRVKND